VSDYSLRVNYRSHILLKTPTPKKLFNSLVTLKPLSIDHSKGYLEIGREAEIWQYLAPEPFSHVADAENWVAGMLKRSEKTGEIPFSVYDNSSGRLAGSSSYLDVRTEHGGVEIGFTWYGKEFQRTHVNTATKLALLAHAFEELDAARVQLQTDSRNLASQRAIERLGAVKEGVLRKHKICPNGYVRDSVMYSVIIDEWPIVKTRLEGMLNL